MTAKYKSGKNSGSTRRSGDNGDKDRLIAELNNKILFLEKELKSRQDDATSSESTERKLADEKLLENHRFTTTLMANLPGIVYLRRNIPYMTMEFISSGCLRLTGYKIEDLFLDTTISFGQLVHPDDRGRVLDETQVAIKANKPYTLTYRIITAGQEEKWVWDQGRPILKGNKVLLEGFITDITRRKRAEEALFKANTLVDTLMAQAHIGFACLDRELRYVIINEKLAEINGIPVSEHIGKRVHDIVPSLVPNVEKVMGQILATGQPIKDHEFSGETAKEPGVLRYWSESWYPMRDSSGEISGFGAVVEEITERKRAEEVLEKLRANLQKSQEIAHLGSWELDLVSDTLSWSDEVYRIFGLQPGEFGATYEAFLEAVHPDDRAAVDAAYSGSVREGRDTYEIEHRVRRSTGEIRYVHEKCEHQRDKSGRIVRSVGMVHDITERKLADKMLVQQLSEIGAIFKALPDLYFRVSASGVILDYKAGRTSDLYVAPEQFLGKKMKDVLPLEVGNKFVQAFEETLKYGKLTIIEYALQMPGGTQDYEARLIPLTNDQIVIVVRNITMNKQSEKALMDAKSQTELYLDLMGHDISNMHQIALGYLEMAQSLYPDDVNKEFIDKPIQVLQRSTQLIRNVRKLQKLQDGTLPICQVDVCTMLANLQREFGSVPGKTINLKMNCNRDCYVMANDLLYDVFSNLVSNAIKHTGDRANIVITSDKEIENGHRYIRVTVEDDGPGISDDFKTRIFDRVLKGTDKAKGSGLGLYLVKSLVESYGGRVWVEDRVKGDHAKGARFVVMLPAAE